MATVDVGADRCDATEALIALLSARIADKIDAEIQDNLQWLRAYEAEFPQLGDEDITYEDEELWTAEEQWREQIQNR